jgi:hypothetical protein
MLRSIVSIIVGYVVMCIWVMLAFSLALLAPEFAYREGRCEASLAFAVYGLLMTCVGAAVGGYVAVAVLRRATRWPLHVLAGLVLVLGLVHGVANEFRDPPHVSAEEVARMKPWERGSRAVEPTWFAFLVPVLGCASVLVGGTLRTRTE